MIRLLEHVHGHLGWLAVVALLHPAILLRNPKRRARLSAILSTSAVLLTGALGTFIYPEYRARLKQQIFIHAPNIGWWFERKEHLAVGALGFALIGCIAHLAGLRFESERLMILAHRSYVASFALALIVAVIGVSVATYSTF